MVNARDPDAKDQAVLAMAERVMSVCDPSSYSINHSWVDAAGMWFVEVDPVGLGAAPISLYHGGDTLNVCFGATWFEYFSFELPDIPIIEQVLESIRDGGFEQAGSERRAFARIYVPGKTWDVGHVHVWPWRWRTKTRFDPYPLKLKGPPPV